MYLNNESGRSMVEMLGVLAVIGVLSVAGIAGFKNAMDKNKANTIINEAQKRATLVVPQIQLQNSANPTLNEFSNNNLGYAEFDTKVYTKADNLPDGQFGIKVSGVSKEICQNILNTLGDNTVIRRLSTTDAPTTALTTCGETNTFLMVYNNDMTSNPVAGEYTFDTCPESFYQCATTTSCVASENDCPSICALDEDLSSGCVCPAHRDRTDNKCGDCVDEKTYQPWTQPVLTANSGEGYGTVSATSVTLPMHEAFYAFDGVIDGGNKWCGKYRVYSADITWDLPTSLKISSVKFYTTDEQYYLERFPKKIKIYGFNDSLSWHEIGVSENHTMPNLNEYVTVNCDNSEHYNHLKFNFQELFDYSSYSKEMAVAEIQITANELVSVTNYELDASTGQCVEISE